MKTFDTTKQANELVASFFGFDVNEVTRKTFHEETTEKMANYRAQDELGRAQLYAVEVTDNARLKRQILEFSNEFITTIRTFEVYDYIPAAYKRETMRFFNSHFSKFDKNAANALGQHMKKSIAHIKQIPGALLERGRSSHLSNDVMRRLIGRSRNSFFVYLRKDQKLINQFKIRLDKYCEMVWLLIMQEEGTIYADMPLADKVARRSAMAENLVEDFLNEKCKVRRDSEVQADKLYTEYEKWALERDAEMLGRKTFTETVFNIVPYASQKISKGTVYVTGLRIAN